MRPVAISAAACRFFGAPDLDASWERSASSSELGGGDPDLSEVLLTTRSKLEFARREAGS